MGGFKDIMAVTSADKVWNGEKWVNTKGTHLMGWKPVINVDGVLMTEDHKILTHSWKAAKQLVSNKYMMGLALGRGGDAWLSYVSYQNDKAKDQLLVQCDCGEMPGRVYYDNVRAGKTTQCNICALEATKKYRKKYFCYEDAMPDDAHRTRLLNRLSAAIVRTTSPGNKSYKNYGARGITVFDQWRADKRSFLRYVQTLEGWDDPNLEMDRIDTDGNYEPGNIRFVSRSENCRNRRRIPELQRKYDAAVARIAELEREINLLRASLRPD
ncbi:HNH endonuclease [Salmonella phage SS3e]|uniref:Uncharacterized protein n=1 Tax=Salmonella phage SS3e TaxID=293644 RepID=Q5IGW9_9CAUD|nr:HNH endonuclease [Salmonella phage SS3e]AAW51247.2 hypothetical protein [Salmonella phage SS3e]